jgi:hypothetical protein
VRSARSSIARVEYVRVAGKGALAELRSPDVVEAGMLVRTPLVDGGDPCAGAIAGYAIQLGWLAITPRISACREHARNAFVTSATDDFIADARASHAWHVSRVALAVQVQAGAAMLHQRFTTAGLAPARAVGAALFGGGASLGVALGHGMAASVATELDTFVLRRDTGVASSWSPTLALAALVAVERAL